MPPSSSLSFKPAKHLLRSPSAPSQLVRNPAEVMGFGRIAGDHSTVWILAISARVDEPRLLKQPLVVPHCVVAPEHVADRVVLEREETVEEAQANPGVFGKAGDLAAGDSVETKATARPDEDLAVAANAQRRLLGGGAARTPASRPTSACSR